MIPIDHFLQELSFLKLATAGARFIQPVSGYNTVLGHNFPILFWSLSYIKMRTLPWFGIKSKPRKKVPPYF